MDFVRKDVVNNMVESYCSEIPLLKTGLVLLVFHNIQMSLSYLLPVLLLPSHFTFSSLLGERHEVKEEYFVLRSYRRVRIKGKTILNQLI